MNWIALSGNHDDLPARGLSALPGRTVEQRRIATRLSSLDAPIIAGTQKLEGVKTQKKRMMQQLFPSPEEE